jgi:malate synthase
MNTESDLRPRSRESAVILSQEALRFLSRLTRRFREDLRTLLGDRQARQAGFDLGDRPRLEPGSGSLREGEWTVAALPAELAAVTALERADFGDGPAPTLERLLAAQFRLHQGARQEPPARAGAAMPGPRGLHLPENHLRIDGEPIPACLFDAGLFLFHNARELLVRGATPCLSLARLEHHLEARWWNRVLAAIEEELDLPGNSIRTVLRIETLPAAFQMDELLHEQRQRAVGLAFGHRNYLASFIQTLRMAPGAVLPDRDSLGVEQPFLQACARRLARTCQRRGCLDLGEPAGFPPKPGAPLPHPVLAAELLEIPYGPCTEAGLRSALRVGIRALEAWLAGPGWVIVDGQREDIASADLARLQLWQWVKHRVELPDLGRLDRSLFHRFVHETLLQIGAELGPAALEEGRFLEAADLLETQILAREPSSFLTLPAYALLLEPALLEVH